MFERVQRQAGLFREMIERAGVDPGAAAKEDCGGAFAMAARLCLSCPHACACRDWLDGRASGPAPEFCRNAAYLARVTANAG
jgi:hypothetical protein